MPARVGIGVIVAGRETVTVNNDRRFPLMSVFKFHQALAVVDRLAARGIPLETEICVTREDLPPNTWSPLRDARPGGGFGISIAELPRCTLQQSDNNACDILFDRIRSAKDTETYIHRLGITDCAISATEADMHADLARCRDNWTTPLAAARLLEHFLTDAILPRALHEFIRATMIGCTTGADRLAKPLAGTGAVPGHKAGTSDRDAAGRLIALNDAGFVLLLDGGHYVIAVFIYKGLACNRCGDQGHAGKNFHLRVPAYHAKAAPARFPIESGPRRRPRPCWCAPFVDICRGQLNFPHMRRCDAKRGPEPADDLIYC